MLKRICLSLAVLVLSTAAFATDKVIVNVTNAKGASVGTATIQQEAKGVSVHLALIDLPPGVHAIHFHQTAMCTPPAFTSAGGHFNPTGAHHGLHNPASPHPHAGDMENFTVASNGASDQTVIDDRVTLQPGLPNSLFGTALVIHAKADDMKSDPAGNAGDRIACGVITQ
jgi:Cu-Zn family superoxide dismutase